MGLTKQYLRFSAGPVFGIIASPSSKILFLNFEKTQDYVAVAACENVLIWNYNTNQLMFTLHGDNHGVTTMTEEVSNEILAVGYTDGMIRIFNLVTESCTVSLCGHKSAVSCLVFDREGKRLASGGIDTEIVIWDILKEAGIFRLKGHKGAITKCHFFTQRNILVSSSKDTFLKFWNLDTQHCFKTVVENRAEVWDFVVLKDSRLITGISDSNLRVWDVGFVGQSTETQSNSLIQSSINVVDEEGSDNSLTCHEVGKIVLPGEKKVILGVDKNERLLGCHSFSKVLHLFKLLTPDEIAQKLHQSRNKKKKMMQSENGLAVDVREVTVCLTDEIQRMKSIVAGGKIGSFSILTEMNQLAKIGILLNNNCVSIYNLDINRKDSVAELSHCIQSHGHHSNVKALAFSSDSLTVLSASNESIKIWNVESQNCVRTIQCEFALCSVFVTGNSYCVVGTKTGNLQIFDITSGNMLENITSHNGSVNCLCCSPDQRGLASGSSDKDVKFWDFELVKDENYSETEKRLSLSHSRTLKMPEEVLCIKYSPNQKMFASSLNDNTVKVFFADTLKFAFSLYGHKLPVKCMDISYDSQLLVTGSGDKNIKIWSMEFGSCNKSIFAHDDPVTCLYFLPKTHMFFSGSKDKKVKQWDADNFQKIITLEGHQSEVSTLSVSPDGMTVITSSLDKSLRIWEKTNEPLILEEEQQIERELEMDKSITSGDNPVIVGEWNKEVALASKKTIQAIKSVEQIVEAIDIFKEEISKLEEYKLECQATGKCLPAPIPHPLLAAFSASCPHHYMLKVLQRVKSSDMEEMLLHLPFNYVLDFIKILLEFLCRKWRVELSTRCVLFLFRIHMGQILGCRDIFPVIHQLKGVLRKRVGAMRDIMGFNSAGEIFFQKQIVERVEDSLCINTDENLKQKRKLRKTHKSVMFV